MRGCVQGLWEWLEQEEEMLLLLLFLQLRFVPFLC
jgi:hypothetical protein